MKLLDCPICGKTPTAVTLVYSNGRRSYISCSGSTLLDVLVAAEVKNHKPINTGKRNTKRDASMAWNKIVKEYKATLSEETEERLTSFAKECRKNAGLPNDSLTAAQEPRVNPEEAASQEETSSELNRHEVQPRLGFEKGVAP